MHKLLPVVLSGGAGTRLWPSSRQHYPKQFLRLTHDQSLYQLTLERVAEQPNVLPPLVIANQDHRFLAAQQAQAIDKSLSGIVLEPFGRNTAAACALAALHGQSLAAQALGQQADPILLVLPSDHLMEDPEAFNQALVLAMSAANQDRLVTFGVVPHRPETGYGYIQATVPSAGQPLPDTLVVRAFHEKPNEQRAQEYLASGHYFWNSGMFVFKSSVILAELERCVPEVVQACRTALQSAEQDMDFVRLEPESFSHCPSISIDYAVMEKTDLAVVVPLKAGWSDVGSWASLSESQPNDEQGNHTRGDVVMESSTGCFVQADSRLVALVGAKDLVVVETADAVLVAHRDASQDVKSVVATLARSHRPEALIHREVHRPWGSYDTLAEGPNHKVKRIRVNPGASISLQMHHRRAEHWVVVSGQGEVTLGDRVMTLGANESIYIPAATKHRLANRAAEPLVLIEVQTGDYLEEDDIVRFEDQYGRHQTPS